MSSAEEGLRLDRFLRGRLPNVPRTEILTLLSTGRVRYSGRMGRKGLRVAAGERVEIVGVGEEGRPVLAPDPDMLLEILYEDGALVAVNKPPAVACHPLQSGEKGTVANGLIARYPEMASLGFRPLEAGLVHRLDRDTSGVLLAARTTSAFKALRSQFASHQVEKVYLALVMGDPGTQGLVCSPIGSRGRRGERVVVVQEEEKTPRCRHVRPAETRFKVLRSCRGLSLVRLWMKTGVRHQLRAHMASIGCPVVGDRAYGSAAAGSWPAGIPEPPRQMLHASELRFCHPETGKQIRVCAPLEESFSRYLKSLGVQGAAWEAAQGLRSLPV